MTPPTRSIPRPVHKEPIGGCPYTVCVRVRPLPPHTLNHPSAIIHHPFHQLFFNLTQTHTFPVPDEPTKAEVHQIPSHPAMICSTELLHYLFFVTVPDGSPIGFLFLHRLSLRHSIVYNSKNFELLSFII